VADTPEAPDRERIFYVWDDNDDVVQPLKASFALHEYAAAGTRFFSDAVSAVSRADGVLSMIRTEKAEYIAVSQNTLDDGEIVEMEPILTSSVMTFTVSDGIAGDFDEVHVAIAETAAAFSEQLTKRILQNISELCDGTGNVVNAKGRSIWEAQLEALETIQITFDEDGNPSLPSIVMHPDTADNMGDPPEDFRPRYDSIVERRRDEWLARRRTRRLSTDGD